MLKLEFQSTHPRGVRHRTLALSSVFLPFQSTHPRGVRQNLIFIYSLINYISIHAPARGATRYNPIKVGGKQLISIHAPARGATRYNPIKVGGKQLISIHAPARGATRIDRADTPKGMISIHAPARGATSLLLWWRVCLLHFNPRTREGCD